MRFLDCPVRPREDPAFEPGQTIAAQDESRATPGLHSGEVERFALNEDDPDEEGTTATTGAVCKGKPEKAEEDDEDESVAPLDQRPKHV